MSSLRKYERNVNEYKSRCIQEIISAERLFEKFSKVLASYTKKAKGIRDKNDKIAKTLSKLLLSLNFNFELRSTFITISYEVYKISALGDKRISSLKANAFQISQFGHICNITMEDVDLVFNDRKDEVKRKFELSSTQKKNPRYKKSLRKHEKKLYADISGIIYEYKKSELYNLKLTLQNFVTTELDYHEKATTHLRSIQDLLNNLDEETYLKEVDQSFRMPDKTQSEIVLWNLIDKAFKLKRSHSTGHLKK